MFSFPIMNYRPQYCTTIFLLWNLKIPHWYLVHFPLPFTLEKSNQWFQKKRKVKAIFVWAILLLHPSRNRIQTKYQHLIRPINWKMEKFCFWWIFTEKELPWLIGSHLVWLLFFISYVFSGIEQERKPFNSLFI